MHIIKFRGKSLSTGEWVYGWYVREARGLINGLPAINLSQAEIVSFIVYSEEGQLIIHEVDPNTVGQYTGKKDTKENEIYEHDIVRIIYTSPYEDSCGEYIAEVVWHEDAMFEMRRGEEYIDNFEPTFNSSKTVRTIEVISSIHDTPKLLTSPFND